MIVVFLLGSSLAYAFDAPAKDIGSSTGQVIHPTSDSPSNQGPTSPDRVLPGEPPRHKNYWIPALEIPAFEFLLNRLDRHLYDEATYGTTWASGWDHVEHGHWSVDQDAFTINQIGHPYQGSVYYGFARSSGLNFWESLLYSNAGSYLWETYGENTNPSINDQVASGTAGALLGEPLFRMSNLILESGDENEKPGFWRELGAAVVDPPAELNRLVFGEHFGPVLERRGPATFMQFRVGAGQNITVHAPGSSDRISRDMASADFLIDYGLPGKSGYRYMRPFDYFHFQAEGMVESQSTFEGLIARGLLFGSPYETDDNTRGIWGLYGSYDYQSPQVFRLSTTAISLGTTFQRWLTRHLALQGTGTAGIGYGAAGTIVPTGDESDFHYGAAPQALLSGRLIFDRRAMLDITANEYYITSIGASKAPGQEQIMRLDSSFTVRVIGHHALGIHFLMTSREARYKSGLPDRNQLVQTVVLAYSYASDFGFGAVHWGSAKSDE